MARPHWEGATPGEGSRVPGEDSRVPGEDVSDLSRPRLAPAYRDADESGRRARRVEDRQGHGVPLPPSPIARSGRACPAWPRPTHAHRAEPRGIARIGGGGAGGLNVATPRPDAFDPPPRARR